MRFSMKLLVASGLVASLGTDAARGTVWPQSVGPMEHVNVFWDDQAAALDVQADTVTGLALFDDGMLHTPPSDVLDGKGYNNQPGFLKGEAFAPPTGTGIWVEVLAISPGLETYEGGMRSAMMVQTHTYAPILSAVGARWLWGGSMHHPWYAAADAGEYSVTYRLYIGDEATGDPLLQYGADTAELSFVMVPEPGTLGVLLGSSLLVLRRRSVRCAR